MYICIICYILYPVWCVLFTTYCVIREYSVQLRRHEHSKGSTQRPSFDESYESYEQGMYINYIISLFLYMTHFEKVPLVLLERKLPCLAKMASLYRMQTSCLHKKLPVKLLVAFCGKCAVWIWSADICIPYKNLLDS